MPCSRQSPACPPETLRETGEKRLLVTCHRRESWGSGLSEIGEAVAALATESRVRIDVVLHPNPIVAEPLRQRLGDLPAVNLLAPLSHGSLVERMRGCDLVLSDSGGIQEEAPALGIPLLILRDKTERPEALASGNARLVGVKAERIIAEAGQLLDDPAGLAAMAHRSFPFGDGKSAPHIAGIVHDWFAKRRRAGRA